MEQTPASHAYLEHLSVSPESTEFTKTSPCVKVLIKAGKRIITPHKASIIEINVLGRLSILPRALAHMTTDSTTLQSFQAPRVEFVSIAYLTKPWMLSH
jgi:hypothetical protein